MNRKLDTTLVALSASGLLLAMTLLAATPVDRGSGATASDAASDIDTDDAMSRGRRGGMSARRGLAMPYFSFAHGMRRIGG